MRALCEQELNCHLRLLVLNNFSWTENVLVSKVKSRNQDRDHALPVSYVRMICREGYIPPPHSWIYRRFKSFWLKSYLRHDSKWSFQLGRDKVFKISDSHGIFVFISRSLRIKTYRILRILGCTVFRSKYDDMGWGEGQTTSRKENNYKDIL